MSVCMKNKLFDVGKQTRTDELLTMNTNNRQETKDLCIVEYQVMFYFDGLKAMVAPWPPSLIVLLIKMKFFQEETNKIFTKKKCLQTASKIWIDNRCHVRNYVFMDAAFWPSSHSHCRWPSELTHCTVKRPPHNVEML